MKIRRVTLYNIAVPFGDMAYTMRKRKSSPPSPVPSSPLERATLVLSSPTSRRQTTPAPSRSRW
jgi:hypothetical protein